MERDSLEIAVENGVKTIAFPCISTGVYRFPKEKACRIAVGAVKSFLDERDGVERVRFVCFGDDDYELYHRTLSEEA